MFKIRPEFLIPTKSYADNTPTAAKETLDCSLGINPYGFPPAVTAAIRAFDPVRLADYPHTHGAGQAILHSWSDLAPGLGMENLILCDGSISALYLINNLFSKPGAEVVGFVPTFTDMSVNAQMLGMRYTGVAMTLEESPLADVESLLAAVTPETALVYVDNPNNPTGRTLSLDQLARIAQRARDCGAFLLVDEAYGDFIPKEESALTLWDRFDNLLITRTFSKGFGLAGLRAGYIAAPAELAGYIGKISNPYMMNELARTAVTAALTDEAWPRAHAEAFAAVKQAVRDRGGSALTLLPTDRRVPICTLRHRDPTVDLQRRLFDFGVLTVSGGEFDGLNKSSVRLRVPLSQDAAPLLQAVETLGRE